MKNVLFIVNPKSGKSMIRTKLLDIVDIFMKVNFDLTIYISQAPGDARRKAQKESYNYELIVCSGGDGTLDEVISGVMDGCHDCRIGYIPAGSTNDFANSLEIPKDMIQAAEQVVMQREFPCDIGSFNDDYFVYIAAFGLFTNVSYETPQDMKNLLGHLAYVLEGAKKLASIKSYHGKIRSDELEVEGDFLYGMVTNSVSVGGVRNLTGKHVLLDDGVFEVTLIKMPKDLIEFQELITALIMQTSNDKLIYRFRTGHLSLEFDEEIPWTLDGEYGGDHSRVEIYNRHKELTLLV
ncbi:MAG: YegS/Rv2252/BmrU family lipid kinase [Eubacteriales bacterium]|nr:YegS/Rv2252/BmrU family lipid kinase [Eubacteriales bacterium]